MTHPKRPRDPNQLAKYPTPEEIHDIVMALPPDERRDRARVNEAVRREQSGGDR